MPKGSPYAVTAQWDSRNISVVLASLGPKQFAFATALAITRTAQKAKAAEIDAMHKRLDRPTAFTLNSLYLKAATRSHLEAIVWFKDFAPKGTPAGSYLMPQVFGGERKQKRFERALQYAGHLRSGHELVPASGVKLDAYGNVPRSMYSRILSQLHAQNDQAQNETARSRGRKAPSAGGRFFYGNPGGRAAGVWERFTFAVGSAVRPIFIETRTPNYRERFAFFSIAEDSVEANFLTEFDRAADETIRTAKP